MTGIEYYVLLRDCIPSEVILPIVFRWAAGLGEGYRIVASKRMALRYDQEFGLETEIFQGLEKKSRMFLGSHLYTLECENGAYVPVTVEDGAKEVGSNTVSLEFASEAQSCNFLREIGVAGLVAHLAELAARTGASYGWVDSGFNSFTNKLVPQAADLIGMKDHHNILPRVCWITFYSWEIIDRYGRDVLLSAKWHSRLDLDTGCIFVLCDHVLDYDNAADVILLAGIYADIGFQERVKQLPPELPPGGTLVYYPERH